MKREDMRALSADELRDRVAELREEQFRLRFRSATETLEDPLRLRVVRRDIARALTALREKELGTAAPGTSTATAKRATAKRATAKTATKQTAASKTATKTASTRAAKTGRTRTAR